MTTPTSGLHDALVQRLQDVLTSHQDVREVRMFGGVSFMVGGCMAVAAGRDGDLLVRTDPAQYDDLRRRGGEPAYMGEHRPMGRGWLTVPHQQIWRSDELAYWVEVGVRSRDARSRA